MRKTINAKLIMLVLVLGLALSLAGCAELEEYLAANATDPMGHAVPDWYTGNVVPYEPRLNYISTDEVLAIYEESNAITSGARKSYDEYATDWDFVIIDSRPVAVYQKGHINGAIVVPPGEGEAERVAAALPEDKDKLVIFYCGGYHCPHSPRQANIAMDLGYTNVRVYQSGIDHGWDPSDHPFTYLVITPEYFEDVFNADYMGDPERLPIMVIDSRPFTSYFAEHIPLAVVADYPEPWSSRFVGLAPANKDTIIITYCGGFLCPKSHAQARWFVDNGYNNVLVLAGGLPAYKEAGLPVFGTESSGSDFDVSGGGPSYDLTPAQWQDKLLNDESAVVVDLRTPAEISSGMIEGAINIDALNTEIFPSQIASILEENGVGKTQTILLHCAAGARAAGAPGHFVAAGYENVFYLAHSISIDADGNFSF